MSAKSKKFRAFCPVCTFGNLKSGDVSVAFMTILLYDARVMNWFSLGADSTLFPYNLGSFLIV